MYQASGDSRNAQSARETFPPFDSEATARAILARVRKLLDSFTPGSTIDPARTQALLAVPLNDPEGERERLFALGWLHWLNDEPDMAAGRLNEAMRLAREQHANEALAESAYWYARVRLLMGHGEVLGEYETVLKTLVGQPRAAAWFVDLLGRAGRVDRAEQVWKAVRGNRRVVGCIEGPLLEARMFLKRDDWTQAERLLAEWTPSSCVVWVERLLLLAWIAANQKQADKAREWMKQARAGLYPPSALQTWSSRIEERLGGSKSRTDRLSPALHDFVRGQQLRGEGRIEPAIAAYRAALGSPSAQPFARYALACLGQDDLAELLAHQPGLFLAVRCRARLTAARFLRREASPAELLDALRHAEVNGYRETWSEHYRNLANILQTRAADVSTAREWAAQTCADAVGRNVFRATLEWAMGHLSDEDKQELLRAWSQRVDLPTELRSLTEGQLLRLQPEELLRTIRNEKDHPAARLWDAAGRLDSPIVEVEKWREAVRTLRSLPRWGGIAQSLLVQEAAQRGDAQAVLALLDERDAWRGMKTPPAFLLRALEAVGASKPSGWQRGLARWLGLWEPSVLGPQATPLLTQAGLTPRRADTAEPPSGVPVVPWLLHQAARALGQDDAREALTFVRRALAHDANFAGEPNGDAVLDAIPHLQRLARAQGLSIAESPVVLTDMVDTLAAMPEGEAVLEALDAGDPALAQGRLEALSERAGIAPRLAHHLAVWMLRTALTREERDDYENAERAWRRAWRCWLLALAGSSEDRRLLTDYLLQQHRRRINELLARNRVDMARRYADFIRELPTLAVQIDETLRGELAERSERFREELATEYLLTTREAMRFGAIPEGWRADYEKGLTYLRRLLSLDRDNPRLLAALVEICNDWFLDLYHQNDAAALRSQLERFTPFALQLARRIDDRPGDLTARAALSDFWKFRGFVADDAERKVSLYREALRFNPANSNVRDLLAQMNVEEKDS
jgi:hypothetical protein